MTPFESSVLIAAGLLILSVAASRASSRFGVPALLAFLLIGMGAGVHGFGVLPLASYDFAQKLGIFALVFILFSGGMATRMGSIKLVLRPALILSTIGVIISTLLVGVFANRIFGISLAEGCLLGATVSSTDVAAVFTVLRSKQVRLGERVGSLLELESALNDPMTVFLGTALLGLLTAKDASILSMVPLFFRQMGLGCLLGYGFGKALAFIINRIELEFDGLYPVLTIGGVFLAYAVTQFVGGSGFLAVYGVGIVLGNANLLHKRSLIHFHEGITWLMQIAMFLSMGLLVDPAELVTIAPVGVAVSLFLVLVARPVSVFLTCVRARYGWREKIIVSWAGLRGAVPIILATYPFAAHVPRAGLIFNLVFFVTFISVMLQGTTIPTLARWLRVDLPFKERFRFPIEFNPSRTLTKNLTETAVPPRSPAIGKALLELALPNDVLVVLIQRGADVLVPRGGTRLAEGDTLLVLAGTGAGSEGSSLEALRSALSSPA